MALDLEAIKARASHARKTLYSPPDAVTPLIYADIPALIARVEELEAAIQRACDDDICPWARCHEDCPLYPYRGGE